MVKLFFDKTRIFKKMNTADLGCAIEKNLFHIVPSLDVLSNEVSENIKILSESNPSWRQRIFTDADILPFVRKNFDIKIVRAFEMVDPCYRVVWSDLLRYLLIYHYGGVYLDSKSRSNICLDDLSQISDYLICQWDNSRGGKYKNFGLQPELSDIDGGEYQNWVIVSRSGSVVLKAVIDAVVENIHEYSIKKFGAGKNGVLRVSGPIIYTRVVNTVMPGAQTQISSDLGLEYSVLKDTDQHKHGALLHYSYYSHPVIQNMDRSGSVLNVFADVKRKFLILVSYLKWRNRMRRDFSRRARAQKILSIEKT